MVRDGAESGIDKHRATQSGELQSLNVTHIHQGIGTLDM